MTHIPPQLATNLSLLAQVPRDGEVYLSPTGQFECMSALNRKLAPADWTAVVDKINALSHEALQTQAALGEGRAKRHFSTLLADAAFGVDRLIPTCPSEGRLRDRLKSVRERFPSEQVVNVTTLDTAHDGLGVYYTTAPGYGPNLMGQVMSIVSTLASFLLGATPQPEFPPDFDVNAREPLLRFMQPGKKAGLGAHIHLLNYLKATGHPIREMTDYLSNHNSILESSEEDLRERLGRVRRGWNGADPVVIPLVLTHSGLIERAHIVTVIIKEGLLYYYDSKGVASEYHPLSKGQGQSLRDHLKVMQEMFGAGLMRENYTPHQFNAHDCGRHSAHFIYKVVVEGMPLTGFENQEISSERISGFARRLGLTLIQYTKAPPPLPDDDDM